MTQSNRSEGPSYRNSVVTRFPGSAKAQDTLSVLEDTLRRGELELSGASPSYRNSVVARPTGYKLDKSSSPYKTTS